MLILRIRKRTFLVTEQLTIDRSLRDGTAVHGKIRTVFAGRICMYDLRKMLLTHTRFTRDQHTQIGASHLNGYLDTSIEQRAGANDTKTLFYCKKFLLCHNKADKMSCKSSVFF